MSVRGVDLLPLVRGAVEVRCVEIDLFVALDLETEVEVEVEVEDEVGFRARASVPRLYFTPDLFFRPTKLQPWHGTTTGSLGSLMYI